MEDKQSELTDRLCAAMRWRETIAGLRGELIEITGPGKTVITQSYMSFSGIISQDDLDWICDSANSLWASRGLDLAIWNSMGEILWGFQRE